MTKCIKKVGLLILFKIVAASVGIFGEDLMICFDKSLILLINALKPFSSVAFTSFSGVIFPMKNGSSCTISPSANRLLPCMITVVEPSGILSLFNIFAIVPTRCSPSGFASSSLGSFWLMIPMILSFLYASFTAAIDLSLPTVIGNTTPGKSTVFLRATNGKTLAISASLSISTSSSLNTGKNSTSSSPFCRFIL